MRPITALSMAVLVGACESQPDLQIGPVGVYLHDGAIPPDDLDDMLLRMYNCMTPDYNARAIFDVHLHLVPSYAVLPNRDPEAWPWAAGTYDGYSISAQVSPWVSSVDSAIPHELVQHRTPHVMGRGMNPLHADEWVGVMDSVMECVLVYTDRPE